MLIINYVRHATAVGGFLKNSPEGLKQAHALRASCLIDPGIPTYASPHARALETAIVCDVPEIITSVALVPPMEHEKWELLMAKVFNGGTLVDLKEAMGAMGAGGTLLDFFVGLEKGGLKEVNAFGHGYWAELLNPDPAGPALAPNGAVVKIVINDGEVVSWELVFQP